MGGKSSKTYKAITWIPYSYTNKEYLYQRKQIGTRVIARTRQANDNPMYKSLISEGKSATNAYVGSVQRLLLRPGVVRGYATFSSAPPSHIRFKNTTVNAYFLDTTNCPFPNYQENGMSNLAANAKNAAAIKIRQRIHQETTKFSGLQFLGELRDTIHQIKHPAESAMEFAHKYFQDVKRQRGKRYGNKRQLRKAIAGSILELNFGLVPLMNDIGAIAQSALTSIEQTRIKRLSASGSDEKASSGIASFPQGNYTCSYDVESVSVAKHQYTVGIQTVNSLDRHLPNLINRDSILRSVLDGSQNILDAGGFNIDEVIPTLWELLPLSVFMDYFSNIGDVLATTLVDLSNVAWVNSSSRCVTTKYYTNCRFPSDTLWKFDKEQTVSPYAEVETKWVTREVGGVAIPQLRFELPSSPIRLANLGAFLTLLTT